jgi:hypothetical protein
MAKEKEEQSKKLGSVIKKAWEDDAFMQRLLDNATTVLAEEGIQIPEGMKVQAVTNSEKLSYLVVPPKPSKEIDLDGLDYVVGGSGLREYTCWSIMSQRIN